MPETNVTVSIENLAPEGGTFITPVWVGFHNGEFDTYDLGSSASAGLESLAEDGSTDLISQEFNLSGNGSVDGTIIGAEGLAPGPIDPGEVVSQTFTLDSEDPNSQFFNYASMILPSNDAFIANGNPEAIPVFAEDGSFIGADFIIYGDSVLDAGTEVNDEEESSTAFLGQTMPNTGTDENGVVAAHPGFIEGGRILSEDGSSEEALTSFTEADFTEPGYQVARISIRNTDEPLPPPPDLVEVTVTVESLAPENGTLLTPFWVGFHDGNFDTYDSGATASAGLESLAEDGDSTLLSEEFLDSGAGFVEGVIPGAGGATPGPLDAGETTSLTFTVDRSLASSRYFNYASMLLPSNDAFIANGDPEAIELFDEDGNFLGADFVVAGNQVLDAGTEVNDEAEESTAFFAQSAPNTGTDENGTVSLHSGFDPEGRILSSTDFANGDFTAEDYELVRITVTTNEITDDMSEMTTTELTVFGNKLFATDEADEIVVTDSNQVIFGLDGDDEIDFREDSGANRSFGGNGSDTYYLGSGDRLYGAGGDDLFFASEGGDNVITGNNGNDQYWLVDGVIPESANTITDFVVGDDIIGIRGIGASFADLAFADSNAGAVISLNGSELAVLTNRTADFVASENNFTFA